MFGLFNTLKWNNDPNQQKLALMLLEGAKYDATRGSSGEFLNIREMITFPTIAGGTTKKHLTVSSMPYRC